jgi:serine/threonine-protein kinase
VYPWANVSENGRMLGMTPLNKIPLTPGEHALVLANPEKGINKTLTVVIKSGEVTVSRYGLE